MTVLRDRLLDGRKVLLAGEPLDDQARLADQLSELGASITYFEPELDDDGEGGAAWVSSNGPFDLLLYEAGSVFFDGGSEGLGNMLSEVWIAAAAAANGAFIPGGSGGKIVLVAPASDAGPLADAARAALENLARTLSIEWARHSITATVVAPSGSTDPTVVATLVAFVCSAAGDYYSGCRFELR